MSFSRSIGILTSINFLSAIVAVINTIVIAYLFGTSNDIEAYFAAAQIQVLVMSLSQTGQLGEIFLPLYHQLKEKEGTSGARELFSALINWMVVVLAVLVGIAFVCSPLLVSLFVPGFSETKQVLVVNIFIWTLPLIFIQVFNALFRTLANAERLFGRPELIVFMGRIASIIVLICTVEYLGIYSMVLSLWVGAIVNTLSLLYVMTQSGYKHVFCFSKNDFNIVIILKRLSYTVLYVLATQLYFGVLSAGMSQLPQGLYAVFKYVQLLYSKTNSIFLRPISVVFFTHISEKIAAGSNDIKALAAKALSKFLLVSTPAVLFVSLFSKEILTVLWSGDKFPEEHLHLAAFLMTAMFFLLFVQGLSTVIRKTIISFGDVRELYLMNTIVQLLTAACAYVVLPGYGGHGLVITLFFNAIVFTLLALLLLWKKHGFFIFYDALSLFKWGLCAAIVFVIGFKLLVLTTDWMTISNKINFILSCVSEWSIFGDKAIHSFSFILRAIDSNNLINGGLSQLDSWLGGHHKISALAVLMIDVPLVFVILLVVSYVLRISEIRIMVCSITERLKRK